MRYLNRWFINSYVSIFLLIVVISCNKSDLVGPDPKDSYQYFPIEVGDYKLFRKVVYSYSGKKEQIDSLLVKEIVTSKTENKNEIYYTIERQVKGKNDLFFKPETIFQIITNLKQVIKAEKNVYTVLLHYPVYLTSEWNVNQINGQEPKIAEIVENGTLPPSLITDKDIIKVLGDSTNNVVSYLVDCHIFAKNIGLIYEEKTDLEYCQESEIDNPDSITNCTGKKIIEIGKREFITLLEHGKVK
ncbi:MAG: hypothetical protein V4683_02185 [Bacteroidota bacterium]